MKKTILAILAALAVVGCDAGNAPAPMSDADVKTQIDKMSPENRIKFIQNGPGSPEQKEKEIAAIKKEHGLQ